MSQASPSEEVNASQAGKDLAACDEQLENIRHLTYFLIHKLEGITKEDESKNNEIDLDRSNIYSDLLSPIFMHLRKKSNSVASASENNSLYFSELAMEFQEDCSKNGIAVEWDFKLAGTLVDALTAFEMSWDESCSSMAKFKIRGPNGNLEYRDLDDFALTWIHLPFLTGLTYEPEQRAGLVSTLGPLTLAIMLSNETSRHDTLTKTLRESLEDIPMGDSIVACLRDAKRPEECKSVFFNLGNLLLITGDKSSNQIFFPLLFIVKAGDTNVEFSGVKGYKHYMKHLSRFTWKKLSKGTTGDVAQAVFHAMFGSVHEDLGLLGQITTQADWGTRKDIDAAYQTKAAQRVTFTPIGFKYIPNTDVPSLSKEGANPQPMAIDTRKRRSSEFSFYREHKDFVASLSSDIARLIDEYLKKILSGDLKDGTTEWIQPDGSDSNDFVAVESGKYFYPQLYLFKDLRKPHLKMECMIC